MVHVRYFASARAAAGRPEEDLPAGRLADLLDSVGARHGPGLAKLLAGCSYLVDGVARRDLELTVSDDSTVDILPPFAGG